METMLSIMICISLMIIFPQSAQSFLDVGGEYGASWLKEHGEEPKIEETRNNLWNWGSAPKGFEIYNGTVYPPGYAPSWYHPYYAANSTPIIINSVMPILNPPMVRVSKLALRVPLLIHDLFSVVAGFKVCAGLVTGLCTPGCAT